MASANATTDHDQIRKWVEQRGGHPAHLKRTGRKSDPGVLRIDYPGYSGKDTLEPISWDKWFRAFDRNKLAFLFQKGRSRFSKLVDRGTVKAASGRTKRASGRTTRKASTSTRKRTASSSMRKRSASTSTRKRTTPARTARAAAPKRRKTTSTRSRTTAGRTSRSAKRTTDHDEIRQWVEARGGWPATVKGTARGREEAGLLRIDYPGYSGAGKLERIPWDEFFEKFDEENLAFLYQDKANSRFSKLVRR